jgi:predicted heme/steroid binding protein
MGAGMTFVAVPSVRQSAAGGDRQVEGERVVRQDELRRNTGERGTRCFVAHAGIVYDVTDCPKWRTGFHEQLHFAGQDLTDEIPEAPHDTGVFDRPCVRRVGILVE